MKLAMGIDKENQIEATKASEWDMTSFVTACNFIYLFIFAEVPGITWSPCIMLMMKMDMRSFRDWEECTRANWIKQIGFEELISFSSLQYVSMWRTVCFIVATTCLKERLPLFLFTCDQQTTEMPLTEFKNSWNFWSPAAFSSHKMRTSTCLYLLRQITNIVDAVSSICGKPAEALNKKYSVVNKALRKGGRLLSFPWTFIVAKLGFKRTAPADPNRAAPPFVLKMSSVPCKNIPAYAQIALIQT
jgi:hypothetical protein